MRRNQRGRLRAAVLLSLLAGFGVMELSAGPSVEFATSHLTVLTGGRVEVRVQIDAADAGDLFSYGVRLTMSGDGDVVVSGVTVPTSLDFTGFNPGATAVLDPGILGVKGNTQFVGGDFQGYSGTLLATFTLEGVEAGTVNLGLELFRTVGPNEAVFVTTDETVLDEDITFGTATLTVAAPPRLEVMPLAANTVRVRYEMVPGLRYFLRRSEDLTAWDVVAETVGGAASSASLDFPVEGVGAVFFRLEAVPAVDP